MKHKTRPHSNQLTTLRVQNENNVLNVYKIVHLVVDLPNRFGFSAASTGVPPWADTFSLPLYLHFFLSSNNHWIRYPTPSFSDHHLLLLEMVCWFFPFPPLSSSLATLKSSTSILPSPYLSFSHFFANEGSHCAFHILKQTLWDQRMIGGINYYKKYITTNMLKKSKIINVNNQFHIHKFIYNIINMNIYINYNFI